MIRISTGMEFMEQGPNRPLRLWDLTRRDRAVVLDVDALMDPTYKTRLLDLGLQPGTEIECVRTTPFGGPKSFLISDSIFSFDEELAALVIVKLISSVKVFKGSPK